MQMKRSGNKSEAMRDLIKEELGNQKKWTRNIELNENGVNIQDPKVTAIVLMIIILVLPKIFRVIYQAILKLVSAQ
jgi:hypothetical protein